MIHLILIALAAIVVYVVVLVILPAHRRGGLRPGARIVHRCATSAIRYVLRDRDD